MNDKTSVVIYGSGEAGRKLQDELKDRTILAFIDDQKQNIIGSIPVYDLDSFLKTDLATRNYEVILAIPSLNNIEKIVNIYEIFKKRGKRLSFIANNSNLTPLLPLKYQITDNIVSKLLGRDCLNILDSNDMRHFVGKSVLVIGAGGSIGSVISKILTRVGLSKLYCIDTSEINIFNLQNEISEPYCEFFLCDLRDTYYVKYIINKLKPDILINAAAYKHVNMLQNDPLGTFRNNVLAFCNLVDICKGAGVNTFIQVSTDKAADPKNIMGASKLFAERYLASQNDKKFTSKIVRFGNVLGSSGSVLPIFIEQLYRNNTIQVTHPDVERFFMSIPEAAQLVVKCVVMDNPGIYILKMGEPKKILDLAMKLAQLTDIKKPIFEFTKLKSGEKLSERLAGNNEEMFELNDYMFFCNLDPLRNINSIFSDLSKVRSDKSVFEFFDKYLGSVES